MSGDRCYKTAIIFVRYAMQRCHETMTDHPLGHPVIADVPVKFRRSLGDLLQFESTPWAVDAMCKDMDTNIFYDPEQAPVLRAVCGGCPVRNECLDYAVRNLEYGFWGGTTATERASLRRARKIFQEFDWRSKDQTQNV